MNDRDNKELVWVEKEFAEKYKMLENKAEQNNQRIAMFEEYIKKVSDESRAEFKANLETLEENAAMYTGLMLKVKQTFQKTMETSLDAAYKLWEDYDKERVKTLKQVQEVSAILKPIEEQLRIINELSGKIQTWNIDKLIESLKSLTNLTGENKAMFKFLVDKYGEQEMVTKEKVAK